MSPRILTCLSLLAACGSSAPSTDDDCPPPSAPTTAPAPDLLPRGSIAVGLLHACAVEDGRVACWGRADHGQLGPSVSSPQSRPVWIEGPREVAGVSASLFGTCAWSTRGAVWCWGTFGRSLQPVTRVPGLDDAVQVSIDDGLACALRRGGRVSCWADDDEACRAAPPPGPPGRLRRTSDLPPSTPCGVQEVPSITGATEIAAVGWRACAIAPAPSSSAPAATSAAAAPPAVHCWSGPRGEPITLDGSAGATSLTAARQRNPYPSYIAFTLYLNVHALVGERILTWTLNTGDEPRLIRSRSGEPGAYRIAAAPDHARRIDASSDDLCAIGSSITCRPDVGRDREHALTAIDLDVGGFARCIRTAAGRVTCWGPARRLGEPTSAEPDAPTEIILAND